MKRYTIACALLVALGTASCTTSSGRKHTPAAAGEDLTLTLPLVEFTGDVFVDFGSAATDYGMLAVLPFKAAVEMAGVSVSDFFTTELLKTAKYQLIERSRMESILKEQEFSLSGVIDDRMAITLGKVLGVQGVVIGTLSEYGSERVGLSRAPSIGLSVRMIDTTTGKIVWSVSYSSIGDSKLSLSQHAGNVIEDMVMALSRAWIDAGDSTASGLPPPRIIRSEGNLRTATLEWATHGSKLMAGYEVQRKVPQDSDFRVLARLRNTFERTMTYTDTGLLDLTRYDYQVRTVSKYGLVSRTVAEAEAVTVGPPSPPLGLRAASGEIRKIPLFWEPSADRSVAGYIILRMVPGSAPVTVARVTGRETSTYVDSGVRGQPLGDNEAQTYAIVAFNTADVESAPSSPVTATTRPRPSKVAGVQADSGMPRAVAVRWTANVGDEEVETYNVYRAEEPSGPFALVGPSQGKNKTEYADRGTRNMPLGNGVTYYYKVSAVNIGGVEGEQSGAARAATKPAPAAVRGVAASSGGPRQVRVTWRAGPEADIVSYVVYRSMIQAGRYGRVATAPAEPQVYEDTRLPDGATYWYGIAAVDKDGLEGAMSDAAQGSTKPLPKPPTDVTCTAAGSRIEISWTSGSRDSEKYVIYTVAMFGGKKVGESKTTDFALENQKPGTYRFCVAAVDGDGLESLNSAPVQCMVKP